VWDVNANSPRGEPLTVDRQRWLASPDGDLLAVHGEPAEAPQPGRLYRLSTGKVLLADLPPGPPPAFAPDSRRAAVPDKERDRLQLWDAGTGELTRLPFTLPGAYLRAGFSADGRLLATVTSQPPQYTLWDLKTGEQKASWKDPGVNQDAGGALLV